MRGHTRQRTITPKLDDDNDLLRARIFLLHSSSKFRFKKMPNLIFSLFGAVFNGLNLNSEFEPDISANKDSVPQVPITLFAGPPHFVNCLL